MTNLDSNHFRGKNNALYEYTRTYPTNCKNRNATKQIPDRYHPISSYSFLQQKTKRIKSIFENIDGHRHDTNAENKNEKKQGDQRINPEAENSAQHIPFACFLLINDSENKPNNEKNRLKKRREDITKK